jgi:mRNA-degrading endonuclease toxin of MazEF toxin-antitoxin module
VITIPAGQTCSSIMIPITNDTLSQRSKIFYIRLTNPSSNATIGNGFAKVTIVDDEAIPTVSIEDVTVNENAGAALIVVCLSNVSSNPTSITMKTSDGSAVSGSDYGAESDRVLTIPSGVRCITIHLNILDDVLTEKSESFKVILSNISGNATIADGEATINIVDNDTLCQAKAPVISGN